MATKFYFSLFLLLFSFNSFAQITTCGAQLGIDSKCDIGAERYMPLGVAYQPIDGVDPLTNENLNHINKLIDTLKEMGANSLRVYQVCPTGNCEKHDKVMAALKAANINVLIELADSQCSINGKTGDYPDSLLNCFKAKIDEFSQYDNVLGFSVGNEAWALYDKTPSTSDESYVVPSSTVKAAIRDVKAYIAQKGKKIPVGVALRDTPDVTIPLAYYYACHLNGESKDTSADFIGYNTYRYGKGLNTFFNTNSGFSKSADTKLNGFADINVPVIFTEFDKGGDKEDYYGIVDWLFKPNSGAKLISGGMVFRMINRPNQPKYGLYTDNTFTIPYEPSKTDILIEKYKEKSHIKWALDKEANKLKNTCNSTLFSGISAFELDPHKLPGDLDTLNAVSMRFVNYSNKALKVVQNKKIIGELPTTGENGSPANPVTLKVSPKAELFILLPEGENWPMSCHLPAQKIHAGATINNINWGQECGVE